MAARSKRNRHQKAAASPAAPERQRALPPLLPALALIAGCFLAYLGSYHYPPVFDDRVLNPVEVPELTTFCLPPGTRCLSYTSFGLQYLLTGLDTLWLHIGNVSCHALAVIALFVLLRQLFTREPLPGNSADPGRARQLAWLGAAAFAIHPVAVYGVAYLIQRSIVLATFFSLVSLGCLVRALDGKQRQGLWLGLALAAYLAAMLSKEHAVMLPAAGLALAVALGRNPLADRGRRWIWGAAGGVALAGILAALYLRRDVIGSIYEPYVQELAGLREEGMSVLDPADAYAVSLVTQAWLYFKYLLLWVLPWPGWMSADLRQPIASHPWSLPQVLAVPAFLAWGVMALLMLRRRGPLHLRLAGFGLLYPWLMFFTEFATARIQEPFVLYRSYLWAPGLLALLPLITWRLSRPWLAGAGVLLLVALLLPMRDRLATFESNLALWNDVVAKNNDHTLLFVDRGYGNRGVALLREGRLEEAMRDLELTLKLNPRSTHAYANRGTVHAHRGDLSRAIADLDRAVELDAKFAEAHAERCSVLLRMERRQEALQACDRALELASWLPNALLNRAVLNANAGRVEPALKDLQAVLQREPGHAIALYNRGMLRRQSGNGEAGTADLAAACRLGFQPACQPPR